MNPSTGIEIYLTSTLKSMFRLAKIGVLPSIFLYLKDCVPFRSSLMFGTECRRQQITKGKKSVCISKDTANKSGSGVSVDQLQSAKPGLVPQLSGKLTSARIWSNQLTVDHFSDLNYVQLMTSTRQ